MFETLLNEDLNRLAITTQEFRNKVKQENFSSNIGDILRDCDNTGNAWATHFGNTFKVADWVMNTPYAILMRQRYFGENGNCAVYDEDGTMYFTLPKSMLNSQDAPATSAEECCFLPFDFDKCTGKAPLALLCLKDCESIQKTLVDGTLKVGTGAVDPFSANESKKKARELTAKYSFAFYTYYNVMNGLGIDVSVEGIVKPFNGLAGIMASNATKKISAADGLYNAFKSLGCWIDGTRSAGDVGIIAIHPMGYQKLLEMVSYGQFGQLPAGWRRTADDKLFFHEIEVVGDEYMPVDLVNGTATAYYLNGSYLGALLLTDPINMSEEFIRHTYQSDTVENKCGAGCDYYYNVGTVGTNNARKHAAIVNIPLDTICVDVVSEIRDAISPKTIAPAL